MERARPSGMVVDDFRDLAVWQRVDELRREIIAFTSKRPASTDFEFCDQIRGAIGSACRNTSEGFDRFRPAEHARFLEFARGSIGEVQDCLIEAKEKNYIDEAVFGRLWTLTRRALGTNTNLQKYLRWCVKTGAKPWLKRKGRKDPEP
jgi:four helix bundle protein